MSHDAAWNEVVREGALVSHSRACTNTGHQQYPPHACMIYKQILIRYRFSDFFRHPFPWEKVSGFDVSDTVISDCLVYTRILGPFVCQSWFLLLLHAHAATGISCVNMIWLYKWQHMRLHVLYNMRNRLIWYNQRWYQIDTHSKMKVGRLNASAC